MSLFPLKHELVVFDAFNPYDTIIKLQTSGYIVTLPNSKAQNYAVFDILYHVSSSHLKNAEYKFENDLCMKSLIKQTIKRSNTKMLQALTHMTEQLAGQRHESGAGGLSSVQPWTQCLRRCHVTNLTSQISN